MKKLEVVVAILALTLIFSYIGSDYGAVTLAQHFKEADAAGREEVYGLEWFFVSRYGHFLGWTILILLWVWWFDLREQVIFKACKRILKGQKVITFKYPPVLAPEGTEARSKAISEAMNPIRDWIKACKETCQIHELREKNGIVKITYSKTTKEGS